MKFAMKCSSAKINGKWHDVYKDPITDHGKISKPGKLALVRANTLYQTVRQEDLDGRHDELKTIYEDGQLLCDESLETIRARADATINTPSELASQQLP